MPVMTHDAATAALARFRNASVAAALPRTTHATPDAQASLEMQREAIARLVVRRRLVAEVHDR